MTPLASVSGCAGKAVFPSRRGAPLSKALVAVQSLVWWESLHPQRKQKEIDPAAVLAKEGGGPAGYGLYLAVLARVDEVGCE